MAKLAFVPGATRLPPLPVAAPVDDVEETRTREDSEDGKEEHGSLLAASFDPVCGVGCWNMHRRHCMLRLAMELKFCRIMVQEKKRSVMVLSVILELLKRFLVSPSSS